MGHLYSVNFEKAKFNYVTFPAVFSVAASFSKIYYSDTDLPEEILTGSKFFNGKFDHIHFSCATLFLVNFSNVQFDLLAS
jgi:uncharacterized protein YjbI with pentapeptide repeats